ncbi:hypothetical protein SODALDRAFT_91237 [Sodiomyces alkalinus F11]|uniref:Uncharacterized protein n=1 Tax=Sodiomyces alkalinus (strain CBS 110278 / VKM F-3762 / F11) TaxID=1314773 RepID=A0A3N2Q0F0_SODAK|nr:hypothetical protein SODALDRAFT_91237 [Sodiomyces alkalinus F11]ROT40220.1 hypothetical protein SODALDRAFT_91237 [Sodiomyces alkalinus F11]
MVKGSTDEDILCPLATKRPLDWAKQREHCGSCPRWCLRQEVGGHFARVLGLSSTYALHERWKLSHRRLLVLAYCVLSSSTSRESGFQVRTRLAIACGWVLRDVQGFPSSVIS